MEDRRAVALPAATQAGDPFRSNTEPFILLAGLGAAIQAGFVEATTDNVYDRTRRFRLTGTGRGYAVGWAAWAADAHELRLTRG
jgi:hypothetical protein